MELFFACGLMFAMLVTLCIVVIIGVGIMCSLSGKDESKSTTPPNKDIWGASGELPPRSPNKNIWG